MRGVRAGLACLLVVGCTEPVSPDAVRCTDRAARIEVHPGATPERVGASDYVDVTERSGLAWTPSVRDWQGLVDESPERGEDFNQWGGFAVADYNGDDWLDVLFTNKFERPKLFLGSWGMTFTEVPASDLGLPVPSDRLSGASAADFDGDGDMDVLMVGRTTLFAENIRDEGGAFFTVNDLIGPQARTEVSIELSAGWADIDQDGDLDVHIANWGWDPASNEVTNDRLLYREGDQFVDRMQSVLDDSYDDGAGYIGAWTDIDADDDLDLLVIQEADPNPERPGANFLLRNQGPDEDFELVVEECGVEIPGRAMGVGLGDYDLDGDLDVHVTDIGPTKLLEQMDTRFLDVATASVGGFAPQVPEGSWSTFFLDTDNDGREELFTSLGVLANDALDDEKLRPQSDRLWAYGADGSWRDIGPEVGVDDPSATRGALTADFDRDGCLDILTFRLLQGPLLLQGTCPVEHGWLEVQLAQDDGNVHALGARVELRDDDQYIGIREVYAGSIGVFTGGPPEVHFGLGTHRTVDVHVRWPDGTRTCNADVTASRRVRLTRTD